MILQTQPKQTNNMIIQNMMSRCFLNCCHNITVCVILCTINRLHMYRVIRLLCYVEHVPISWRPSTRYNAKLNIAGQSTMNQTYTLQRVSANFCTMPDSAVWFDGEALNPTQKKNTRKPS